MKHIVLIFFTCVFTVFSLSSMQNSEQKNFEEQIDIFLKSIEEHSNNNLSGITRLYEQLPADVMNYPLTNDALKKTFKSECIKHQSAIQTLLETAIKVDASNQKVLLYLIINELVKHQSKEKVDTINQFIEACPWH